MIKKSTSFLIALAMFSSSAPLAFAQEVEFDPENIPRPSITLPESFGKSCFDYYTFNSVSLGLTAELDTVLAGAPFTVSGTITNENTYPLVDGQVYAKVFRKVSDEEFGAQGNDLVAFFKVEDSMVLASKTPRAFTAQWDVPYHVTVGDYQMVFFVTTAERFNHLGLSFTDDIVGYPVDFTVTQNEDVQGALIASKNAVTLNGEPYYFAAFPPHFTKDDTVVAEVVLENPADEARNVAISWNLSNWDGLRSENLLDTVEETITLNPKEKRTLTYIASKYTGAVSYLVFKAMYEDTENILNIRFVRDGTEEERLNFPSILRYPLEKGTENTLFSCVHATNVDRIDNNTLELTLTDTDSGEVIHSYIYTGSVSGAMMAVAEAFTPMKTYVNFDLNAKLSHQGVLVEEVTQAYRCADIDAALCGTTDDDMAEEGSNLLVRTVQLLSGGVIIVLLIASIVFIIRRNRLV